MKQSRGLGFVFQPSYTELLPDGSRVKKTASTWWICFSMRGRRIRENARSANRADAVRLLKRRLAETSAGRPAGPEVDRTSFEDLAEILINDYRANGRRSLDRAEDALHHLRLFFGDGRACDITSDRIVKYQAHRLEEGAMPGTVNREVSYLRRAFNLALRSRRVAERPEFSLLRENNVRTGFFEPVDFGALLATSPNYLKARLSGRVHHRLAHSVRAPDTPMAACRFPWRLAAARAGRDEERSRAELPAHPRAPQRLGGAGTPRGGDRKRNRT